MYTEKIIKLLRENYTKAQNNFKNFLIENNIRPSKYYKSKLFHEFKNISLNKTIINESDNSEESFDYALVFFKNDLSKNHPFSISEEELNLLMNKYNLFDLFYDKYGVSIYDALSEDVIPDINNSDITINDFENDKSELFNIYVMNNIPFPKENKNEANSILKDFKNLSDKLFLRKYNFPKFTISQTLSEANRKSKIDPEDYNYLKYNNKKSKFLNPKPLDAKANDEPEETKDTWSNPFPRVPLRQSINLPKNLLNKKDDYKKTRLSDEDILIKNYEKLLKKYEKALSSLEEKDFNGTATISAYKKDKNSEELWNTCSGIVASFYYMLSSHPNTLILTIDLKQNNNLNISGKLGKSWTLSVLDEQLLFTDIRIPLNQEDIYNYSYSSTSKTEKQLKKRLEASSAAMKIIDKAINNVKDGFPIDDNLIQNNELFIEPLFTKDLQDVKYDDAIMNVITKSVMVELNSLPEFSSKNKEKYNVNIDNLMKNNEAETESFSIKDFVNNFNNFSFPNSDSDSDEIKITVSNTNTKLGRKLLARNYDGLSTLSKEVIKPYKALIE